MAVFAPGSSASNGKSSAGDEVDPLFPADGRVEMTGLEPDKPLLAAPAVPGLAAEEGFAAAAGLAVAFEPGFAFIDSPQNGQSSASSSMTDWPHEGQTGKSIVANSSLRCLRDGLLNPE